MLYLAIDQHAKQITVCVRDEDGNTVLRRQVSTQPQKIEAFFEQLTKMDAEFMAILEVCGFNDWLIEDLRKWKCREMVLIHPERPSKKKTDRAGCAKAGRPPVAQPRTVGGRAAGARTSPRPPGQSTRTRGPSAHVATEELGSATDTLVEQDAPDHQPSQFDLAVSDRDVSIAGRSQVARSSSLARDRSLGNGCVAQGVGDLRSTNCPPGQGNRRARQSLGSRLYSQRDPDSHDHARHWPLQWIDADEPYRSHRTVPATS